MVSYIYIFHTQSKNCTICYTAFVIYTILTQIASLWRTAFMLHLLKKLHALPYCIIFHFNSCTICCIIFSILVLIAGLNATLYCVRNIHSNSCTLIISDILKYLCFTSHRISALICSCAFSTRRRKCFCVMLSILCAFHQLHCVVKNLDATDLTEC